MKGAIVAAVVVVCRGSPEFVENIFYCQGARRRRSLPRNSQSVPKRKQQPVTKATLTC